MLKHLVRIWNEILKCFEFLIYSTSPPLSKIASHRTKFDYKSSESTFNLGLLQTFSDRLWTSAALLLFEERGGAGFTGISQPSAPYFISVPKLKKLRNKISHSKKEKKDLGATLELEINSIN